jgi:hypothetical protein
MRLAYYRYRESEVKRRGWKVKARYLRYLLLIAIHQTEIRNQKFYSIFQDGFIVYAYLSQKGIYPKIPAILSMSVI